jgi:hypothetical protein
MKTYACTPSHGGAVASYQKVVKVTAYKNGDGYRNGKLIVAGTFHGVSGYHYNPCLILEIMVVASPD